MNLCGKLADVHLYPFSMCKGSSLSVFWLLITQCNLLQLPVLIIPILSFYANQETILAILDIIKNTWFKAI